MKHCLSHPKGSEPYLFLERGKDVVVVGVDAVAVIVQDHDALDGIQGGSL